MLITDLKKALQKGVALSLLGLAGAIALSHTQSGLAQTEMPEAPASPYVSQTVELTFTDAEGLGDAVGTVTLQDSEYGLILTPALVNLSPGIHGFHIHTNPACGPAEKEGNMVPGLAAGGHFDPEETGVHEGPYGDGHLGDLPPLYVDAEGNANTPILAPRLTVATLANRSLMVHMHGDNFSDDPAPLGGGGPRLACGVITAAITAE
ncbi:MAG: superoxide dismutase [Cu-Zn] SodC [Phormidesmis sp.]